MVDTLVLLPLLLAVMLFIGAAVMSKSLILGAAGGLAVFGYISVRSGNNLFLGFWLLTMFFMTMASGVWLTKTVMGDTA
jgi:hypothetical protein